MQQHVIDDHHLGMHHDVGALAAALDRGMQESHALAQAGLRERCQKAGAAKFHRPGFEPRVERLRHHEHGFEFRHLAHSGAQGLSEFRKGEVLVLDIDRPLGASDTVKIEPLDLANFLMFVAKRRGARDADRDIAEIRRHAFRPGISAVSGRRGPLASAARPALTRELAEGTRDVALNQGLHVVKRRIGFAGRIDALRIFGTMLAGVPTTDRHVETTAERDRVVDHNQLLVMCGARRKVIAKAEAQSLRRTPLQPGDRNRVPLQRIKHRIVPKQNVDHKVRLSLDQRGEEVDKIFRHAVIGASTLAD